jgi:hypothetical protein
MGKHCKNKNQNQNKRCNWQSRAACVEFVGRTILATSLPARFGGEVVAFDAGRSARRHSDDKKNRPFSRWVRLPLVARGDVH